MHFQFFSSGLKEFLIFYQFLKQVLNQLLFSDPRDLTPTIKYANEKNKQLQIAKIFKWV